MAINYRPLERARHEIRLLKILPPETSSPVDESLDFAQDIVRCELEYESLDDMHRGASTRDRVEEDILSYLLQDIPRLRIGDTRTDVQRLMGDTSGLLRQRLTTDSASSIRVDHGRQEKLHMLYPSFKEKMRKWAPDIDRQHSFEEWLGSWIWTPLSGDESHLERKTLSYFALSYVWRDPESLPRGESNRKMAEMARASGMSIREALQQSEVHPSIIDELIGSPGNMSGQMTNIILDGKLVSVGENLGKALRTLREIPEVQGGARIWADALCINQGDMDEKNHEVKRMGDIYKMADRVISWLGDEVNMSGHALELLHTMNHAFIDKDKATTISEKFWREINKGAALGLTQLFLRPYWHRMWIVQEIVLGGDKSIAICGARRFPMSGLLQCARTLRSGIGNYVPDRRLRIDEEADGEAKDLTMEELQAGVTKLSTLNDAKVHMGQIHGSVHISNTLWFRFPSSSNATDHRDLVYGMMGLLPVQLKNSIHVNYSPETKFMDVMSYFAAANIKATNSLDWILHAPHSSFIGYERWPSWVPNLALPFSSAHWSWATYSGEDSLPFRPARAETGKDEKSGLHIILCKGIEIDRIKQSTGTASMENLKSVQELRERLESALETDRSNETLEQLQALQSYESNFLSQIAPYYSDPLMQPKLPPARPEHVYQDLDGLKDALRNCFRRLGVTVKDPRHSLFDIPFDLDLSNDNLSSIGAHSGTNAGGGMPGLVLLNSMRAAFADLHLWDRSFKDLFPASQNDTSPDSFSLPVVEDRTATFGSLFTTCGGYVGTCLGNVSPGDFLFILDGCKMPVILRPSRRSQGMCELQGGAYVPGLIESLEEGFLEYLENEAEPYAIC